MSYCVRPMRKSDIPQVKDIDRESFPTMVPPPNFEKELQNKMTHYYVVFDDRRNIEQEADGVGSGDRSGLLSRIKRWFSSENDSNETVSTVTEVPFICGYIGFWVMADEAHITTIAVKEECRRHGLGELLMIAGFEQAKKLYANVLTLEVRVSNTGAQQLYLKYGFKEAGIRKHYYTDNREDAYIMTTEDITMKDSQKKLEQLQHEHTGRWGKARFIFSETW